MTEFDLLTKDVKMTHIDSSGIRSFAISGFGEWVKKNAKDVQLKQLHTKTVRTPQAVALQMASRALPPEFSIQAGATIPPLMIKAVQNEKSKQVLGKQSA